MKERCNLPRLKDHNLQLCFCWKFSPLSFFLCLSVSIFFAEKKFSRTYQHARTSKEEKVIIHARNNSFIPGMSYRNDPRFMHDSMPNDRCALIHDRLLVTVLAPTRCDNCGVHCEIIFMRRIK
jgi:hypothetical protein